MAKNKNDMSIVKATFKNLRSSPRKVNNVLRSIRGLKADIALRNLKSKNITKQNLNLNK